MVSPFTAANLTTTVLRLGGSLPAIGVLQPDDVVELRRRHDVELTDVAFAARLEREPELRAAVETWLAGTLLSALDWEQRKHERLLAA